MRMMARKACRLFRVRPARALFLAATLVFVLNPAFSSVARAAMDDYCDVPPNVVQNIEPNIMILLDNSGSMWDYAYYDSGNDCSDYDNPCTGFDPTQTYYGYFDSNEWYGYGSNRFTRYESKSQSATNPDDSYWDGNFLNWLTMRRLDIIKKALTGGLCDGGSGCTGNSDGKGSGFDRLVGIGLPSISYGAYKAVYQSGYMPSKYAGDPGYFDAETTGGNSSGAFYAWNDNTRGWDLFNVKVQVPAPVEGVLQILDVGAKARVGLASYGNAWNQPDAPCNSSNNQYNPGDSPESIYCNGSGQCYCENSAGNGDGGIILDPIPSTSLPSLINDINNTVPSANTPLAESLFTVAGYFAQTKSFTSLGEPGPYDYSGESPAYSVTDSGKDPYNYGTGGQTSYPTCAQSFVLLVTDGEPCEDGDLPSALVNSTDGGGWATGKSPFVCSNTGNVNDGSLQGSCPAMCSNGVAPTGGQCPSGTVLFPAEPSFQSCDAGDAAAGLEDVALWMHTTDLRPDLTKTYGGGPHSLTLYTVFAFGQGSTLLKYASINGGFQAINGDINGPAAGLPYEWSSDGSGNPDNYFSASQGSAIYNALSSAFSSMIKRAESGTAASILAPSQGSGANLVQAVYYPKRGFLNNVIDWTGSIRNLWYYVDPFFTNSNIMEDSDLDHYLTLGPGEDDDLTFSFDTSLGRTMITRYQSNTNGTKGSAVGTDYLENARSLWEGGLSLWETLPSARTIYTSVDGQNMVPFDAANESAITPYLGVANATAAGDVIRWTLGDDGQIGVVNSSELSADPTDYNSDPDGDGISDYRSRTVSEVVNGTESPGTWKLGDIVDSTPQIVASQPLESYYETYGDTSYWAFTNTTGYKNRGTVYVGGNDGMLHAFALGLINSTGPFADGNPYTNAEITGSALGSERWAFIPENVLPYLQYISDPNYCHLYTVDLTPYVFDASTGVPEGCSGDYSGCPKSVDTWRTIVIGGMRLGGASGGPPGDPAGTSCCSTENTKTTVCSPAFTSNPANCCNPCVAPPIVNGTAAGYSEYFALDVTDENNPKLLWEFTSPGLGFATSGPAVVRINASDDPTGNLDNGHWFVVFGSGPTGGIETVNHEFEGESDQDLKYFVFDLAKGPGANNANVTTIDTQIPDAFSGDLFDAANNSGMQSNGTPDYEDDAIYGGYTSYNSGASAWTGGGVLRIFTHDDPNPANWTWSNVITGIGPVTSGVTKLEDDTTKKLWLYFGTGRYYYTDAALGDSKTNPYGVDDLSSQRQIFGITDPCYTGSGIEPFESSCPAAISGTSGLNDVTTVSNASPNESWYINLETGPATCDISDQGDICGSERVITTPVASTTGAVYFTTFKPFDEECNAGGDTYLWGLQYNSGASLAGTMRGMVLLQLSTGSIAQINLSTAFVGQGGRRSIAGGGAGPGGPGSGNGFTPPKPFQPVNKWLYIREEK